jgi:alkyl hydroperoxide reductase subunit AhpF
LVILIMMRKVQAAGLMHRKALVAAFLWVSASTSKILASSPKKYDDVYDLAVIGGGSGGLATAFEASKHGLRTIVIDYVEESPQKNEMGIGWNMRECWLHSQKADAPILNSRRKYHKFK